jgi:hypothetical protein
LGDLIRLVERTERAGVGDVTESSPAREPIREPVGVAVGEDAIAGGPSDVNGCGELVESCLGPLQQVRVVSGSDQEEPYVVPRSWRLPEECHQRPGLLARESSLEQVTESDWKPTTDIRSPPTNERQCSEWRGTSTSRQPPATASCCIAAISCTRLGAIPSVPGLGEIQNFLASQPEARHY